MPPAPLPANEAERLAKLSSYELLDTPSEPALDRLVTLAARLTASSIAVISLVDAKRVWAKASVGLRMQEVPRTISFCAHAILTPEQPFVVTDATTDPRVSDNPLVTGAPGIRFYAGIPLVEEEGFALGTLCVADTLPRTPTDEQIATLQSLAATALATLELRRRLKELRRLTAVGEVTALPDRPPLLATLDRAMGQLARYGYPFALMHLDMGGFRRRGGTPEQAAGDRRLRELAAFLTAGLRDEVWRPAVAATSWRRCW